MKKLTMLLLTGVILLSGCVKDEGEKVETKDHYSMMYSNIVYGEEIHMWSTNTNSKTLGDEINRTNNDEKFIELEETPDGRVIHSFKGNENNENNRWVILSESCGESGQCVDDVDSIELEDKAEFVILYADMKDLTEVE